MPDHLSPTPDLPLTAHEALDREFDAMRGVVAAVRPLTPAARERVLHWALDTSRANEQSTVNGRE
jgi:hypothetical protein